MGAIIHQMRATEMWVLSIYNDGIDEERRTDEKRVQQFDNQCLWLRVASQYLFFIKKMQNAENISIPQPR